MTEFETGMELEHCREACKTLVRQSLPRFRGVEAALGTIPNFSAITERNKTRLVEKSQPDWWTIKNNVWNEAFATSDGKKCLQSIVSTFPFSQVIGRYLTYPVDDISICLDSTSIAKDIMRGYLFAAGSGSWKPHAFDQTWEQCIDFFDPGTDRIKCIMYTPVWGLGGINKKVSLGDGLELRRLSPNQVARIAPLVVRLSTHVFKFLDKRFTLDFLTKDVLLPRPIVVKRYYTSQLHERKDLIYTSELNNEVAMLRAFLSGFVALPGFVLDYNGFPRNRGGLFVDLPWAPTDPFLNSEMLTKQQVVRYAKHRARFLDLKGSPGWTVVMASMRRFAIAWENPFPADALADIIAALEVLLVNDNNEVSYKLRVRAANFLAKDQKKRQTIYDDIKKGYRYRSRVVHGSYVFDDFMEYVTAQALKPATGNLGNKLSHEFSEVNRLKLALASYYRASLEKMIRIGQLQNDWEARGL